MNANTVEEELDASEASSPKEEKWAPGVIFMTLLASITLVLVPQFSDVQFNGPLLAAILSVQAALFFWTAGKANETQSADVTKEVHQLEEEVRQLNLAVCGGLLLIGAVAIIGLELVVSSREFGWISATIAIAALVLCLARCFDMTALVPALAAGVTAGIVSVYAGYIFGRAVGVSMNLITIVVISLLVAVTVTTSCRGAGLARLLRVAAIVATATIGGVLSYWLDNFQGQIWLAITLAAIPMIVLMLTSTDFDDKRPEAEGYFHGPYASLGQNILAYFSAITIGWLLWAAWAIPAMGPRLAQDG